MGRLATVCRRLEVYILIVERLCLARLVSKLQQTCMRFTCAYLHFLETVEHRESSTAYIALQICRSTLCLHATQFNYEAWFFCSENMAAKQKARNVLVLYTGGTLGMIWNDEREGKLNSIAQTCNHIVLSRVRDGFTAVHGVQDQGVPYTIR